MSDLKQLEATYASIVGGPEMLAWFGHVPSFHDAEIVNLTLNRRKPSHLKIHYWVVEKDGQGFMVSDKHAVVTFELDQIYDLQLDGFSDQNVIGCLAIQRGLPDPVRKSYYTLSTDANDFEIVLEPCYGMDGVIRCKSITISFIPGKPEGMENSQASTGR